MEAVDQEPILNEGLSVAVHEGWHLREKLMEAHPELSPKQLDEIVACCQAVLRFAGKQFASLPNLHDLDTIYRDAIEPFTRLVRAKYPWVSDENVSSMLGQAIMTSVR